MIVLWLSPIQKNILITLQSDIYLLFHFFHRLFFFIQKTKARLRVKTAWQGDMEQLATSVLVDNFVLRRALILRNVFPVTLVSTVMRLARQHVWHVRRDNTNRVPTRLSVLNVKMVSIVCRRMKSSVQHVPLEVARSRTAQRFVSFFFFL